MPNVSGKWVWHFNGCDISMLQSKKSPATNFSIFLSLCYTKYCNKCESRLDFLNLGLYLQGNLKSFGNMSHWHKNVLKNYQCLYLYLCIFCLLFVWECVEKEVMRFGSCKITSKLDPDSDRGAALLRDAPPAVQLRN